MKIGCLLATLFLTILTESAAAQYFLEITDANDTVGVTRTSPPPEGPTWDFSLSAAAAPLDPTPFWESTELGVYSTGMIWRDCNLDGYIDLFIANGNDMALAANAIYFSGYGQLQTTAVWRSADAQYSGHCAVGDIDDNGYPDFVIANYLGSGRFETPGLLNMYANDFGVPSRDISWQSEDSIYSFSCALGDVDGDGDLDLAVATGEGYTAVYTPDQIYFNEDGVLQAQPGWESSASTAALDVVWGDVDNDGDLDLAFCYDGLGAALYYNEGGTVNTYNSWSSANAEAANTLIFGDVNGDGWLDLIVAFNDQLGGLGKFRAYFNDGAGNLDPNPGWESSTGGYGSGLAVFDYDNDGDDDLAAGRWWDRPRIYENIGGTFTTDPVWRGDEGVVVEELAWIDVDHDGVEMMADTFLTSGRKLFYTSHDPLQSIDSVLVDGAFLSDADFCYDLVSGWVSLGSPIVDSIVIYYQGSLKNDLAVSTWDDHNVIYGNTDAPRIDAYRDLTVGSVPLTVDFWDNSVVATEWFWDFGDGYTSADRNPSHVYEDAGTYDLYLEVLFPDGKHSRIFHDIIAALADTLAGDEIVGTRNQSLEMILRARNTVELSQIRIPIEYNTSPPLVFDSFSTVECRTEYFGYQAPLHIDPWYNRRTIKLECSTDGSLPPLPEGEGAIIKLYFTIPSSAISEQVLTVDFDGYDSFLPKFIGGPFDYVPQILAGSVTVDANCCENRGDYDHDGQIDVSDIVAWVHWSFDGGPITPGCEDPPGFYPEVDMDASDQIDVADIVYWVNWSFNNGDDPIPCP